MDNLYIKTKNLKDDVGKKLDEMDQIFNITKNFSGHFDIHVNKLQTLVLSLLITDFDFDEFDETDFNLKNDNYIDLDKIRENKLENINFQKNFSDRVFNKNNANRIVDINPNFSTIEHVREDLHNETIKKDNNQLAFVEIFKEQNSNLVKMMETGQENSKTLREMFNSIYEAFLSQSKQVPEGQLKAKFKEKKNLLKKRIEELEKENMELKIKSNRIMDDELSNYSSIKLNKIQEENIELGKEINKLNNINLIFKERNLKLINELQNSQEKTLELKNHVKEMEICLNDLSRNILNSPLTNMNSKINHDKEIFSANINSTQETNNINVEKILKTNLELIELIKNKNSNTSSKKSYSNPFKNSESIEDSKKEKPENLIIIEKGRSLLDSFGNFNHLIESEKIIKKKNSAFKNIFKEENNSENNEPIFNVIIDTKNNSEISEDLLSHPREKRESVNTFIQMNSVDSDQNNLFRSETQEKNKVEVNKYRHHRVQSGDKKIKEAVNFVKKDNHCIFIKNLPLPGSEKY